MGQSNRQAMAVIFFTLLMDLMGFSIIFPLFAAMAKYYLEVDGQNVLLKALLPSTDARAVVLFGGALGALYSFLQFLAAPLWGRASDRLGRRPVLLICTFSMVVASLIWALSGNFALLVLSRLVSGIMGGNISVATAAVADMSSRENRPRAMAMVGVAFSLGLILGPAIGGWLGHIDLTSWGPQWTAIGINPFSAVALGALGLALLNFLFVKTFFRETWAPGKSPSLKRTISPRKLLSPLPYPGINGVNLVNFLFVLAFSGMEFTLVFLTLERFAFSPKDNALMFVFVGVVMAIIQGTVVRRWARPMGERAMAVLAMALTIPGLWALAWAPNLALFYGGLFFLALGSAMAIPCLTSLASLYCPPEFQGEGLGRFRSLGALARAIGPMVASLAYHRWGSGAPYWAASAFLLLPLAITAKLPVRSLR